MSGETPAGPFGHALARLREAEQQMQAAVKLARAVIHGLAAPLTPPGVWVKAEDFRGEPDTKVYLWVMEPGMAERGMDARLDHWVTSREGRMMCLAESGWLITRADITPPAPPVLP